jgi:DNA-binding transcriptional LysR family regulator
MAAFANLGELDSIDRSMDETRISVGSVETLDTFALQVFVAVAETENMSNAAAKLDRSTSAVSMQIKNLEVRLRTSLFERRKSFVKLTRSGQKLLPYAKRILELSNEAAARLQSSDLKETVRLGAPFDVAGKVLPPLLKHISTSFPHVLVEVIVDGSRRLYERFRNSQVDIAVINCSHDFEEGRGETISNERLIWAGAAAGKSYRRGSLALAAYESDCIWHEAAVGELAKVGRHFRVVYAGGSEMIPVAAVLADLAVAALPARYIDRRFCDLSKKDGLPPLPTYEVRLLTAANEKRSVRVVAGAIRSYYEGRPTDAWSNKLPDIRGEDVDKHIGDAVI